MGTGWKINRIGRKPNFKGTQSKITKILRNPIKNKSISKIKNNLISKEPNNK